MQAKIYPPSPANLRRLAAALRRGELVAMPTETVYGLAADALNAKACRAIFRAKGRPAIDPLIVHVLDLAHAEELAEFTPAARRLARRFWPGPLTLVLPKKKCVPDIVTSGGNTIAIRAPAHPLARQLLRLAKIPLAAPSANLFGYISPTNAQHVLDGLGRRIQHVLDGGACPVGVESTILDMAGAQRPRILRHGAVTASVLEKFLGQTLGRAPRRKGAGQRQLAPGMLARHYSPRTPLQLKSPDPRMPSDIAGIFLRRPKGQSSPNVYWLSERGSLAEVARNLYRVLREADQKHYRQIWVERLPVEAGGLAAALQDRLQRAAARR